MLGWTGWIIPGVNFFPFLCKSVPGKKKMGERVTGRYSQTLESKGKGETKGKDFNLSRNNNWGLFWFVGLGFFLGGWSEKMKTRAAVICATSVSVLASGTSEVQNWDLSMAEIWLLVKKNKPQCPVFSPWDSVHVHLTKVLNKRSFTTFENQGQTVNSVFYCYYQI